MNASDRRVFARCILLGLILMGIGYDVASMVMPAPVPTHLVCVDPAPIDPAALCHLLIRR